jgi:hypothetical protein
MRSSRHHFRAAALVALAGLSLTAGTGAAATPPDTDVTAVMHAAAADIRPGLCAAGDTPLCIGPYEAQIHLYSQACTGNGIFEGRPIAGDSACGIDLSAFMLPSVEGLSKPNCLTSHTYTSDAARRFGKPVNEVVIGGVARKMQLSYPAAVLGFRTAFGWVDGPDRDEDPIGDHSLVFSIQVRPPDDSAIYCVTAPMTSPVLTGVLRVFDDPTRSAEPS